MDVTIKNEPLVALYSLRKIAMLAMAFFLIIIILTALVVVPKINAIFESQNASDIQVDLALEAELFTNYVESQKSILQDLAQFPSLVNAAMQSDASNPVLIDLLDNVVIGGESGRLVLQDIAGSALIQTTQDLQARYDDGGIWLEELLDGTIPYHFELLSQVDERFTFKISIPINYNSFTEGVLSAEITAPLDQVFVAQSFDNHIAFKLVQDQVTVTTDNDHIEIAHEVSLELEHPNLTFVYVTDAAVVLQKEREIRNTILFVLLIGLTISFLLFALYGYRTQSHAEKIENEKISIGRAYIIPMVVAAIGVAVSTIACLILYNVQIASIDQKRISDGKAYVQSIQQNINRKLEILKSFSAFYEASSFVDRQEFSTFAEPFIASHPDIQAFAWIPNVSSKDRIAFEDQAKKDGLDKFDFKELGADKKLHIASTRDQHFPVFYAAPMEGNEKVFGFDLASNVKRLSALSKASRTGDMTATAPVQLVEETESQTGVLVFSPVFRATEADVLADSGEFSTVEGFLLLVMRMDDIFSTLADNHKSVISAHIRDISDTDKREDLFGDAIPQERLTFSRDINIAGRSWQVDTSTTAPKNAMKWIPWLVLLTGYVISALVTIGLVHLIRRREIVELLVKQRTAELRMLSSIAANSNDIFIVTSADELDASNGGPEILYVNEAFTRYTGYSFDEAVGKTPRLLQGVNTDRGQLDSIRDALLQGQTYQGELINYKKNNEEYWVDINIIPLKDESGKIIQFAAVQRDITERVRGQVEREILIDKLTDSNEELARFAFVCSHDLQEPLRMVRSFSEKLQAHLQDGLLDDEKGQKYFRFITDGAARAQDLIADILNYSSIDSDIQQLQQVDGNQLIDSIRSIMEVSLQNCGGRITSDQLPELQGNRTQLYQLFQNIINNAIKYQKTGTAPSVHISTIDAGKHWQFAISDNGIGIEQRHLEKIFDVFQRLHRKSQYAGTGVGLSICKKVVERHGGTLWVESEQNVGTTFYFTLLKPVITETKNERPRKAS